MEEDLAVVVVDVVAVVVLGLIGCLVEVYGYETEADNVSEEAPQNEEALA